MANSLSGRYFFIQQGVLSRMEGAVADKNRPSVTLALTFFGLYGVLAGIPMVLTGLFASLAGVAGGLIHVSLGLAALASLFGIEHGKRWAWILAVYVHSVVLGIYGLCAANLIFNGEYAPSLLPFAPTFLALAVLIELLRARTFRRFFQNAPN